MDLNHLRLNTWIAVAWRQARSYQLQMGWWDRLWRASCQYSQSLSSGGADVWELGISVSPATPIPLASISCTFAPPYPCSTVDLSPQDISKGLTIWSSRQPSPSHHYIGRSVSNPLEAVPIGEFANYLKLRYAGWGSCDDYMEAADRLLFQVQDRHDHGHHVHLGSSSQCRGEPWRCLPIGKRITWAIGLDFEGRCWRKTSHGVDRFGAGAQVYGDFRAWLSICQAFVQTLRRTNSYTSIFTNDRLEAIKLLRASSCMYKTSASMQTLYYKLPWPRYMDSSVAPPSQPIVIYLYPSRTCSTLTYIHMKHCTLHCIALHYITSTLHYIYMTSTSRESYVTIRYITLHMYITLHYHTTLSSIHYITLDYITLHYVHQDDMTLHHIISHAQSHDILHQLFSSQFHCTLWLFTCYSLCIHSLHSLHSLISAFARCTQ